MASMSRRSFLQLFGASAAAVAGLGLVGCGGSSNSGSSDSKVETIKSRGKLKCGVKKDVVGYGLLNTSTNSYEGMEIDLCYQVAAKVFGCSYDEAKSKDLCEFTDVRKKSWDFTDPYRTDHVGILIKKGSMSSMADLDGKHIGVSQGSTTKGAITKMLADNGFSVTPQFDEYPDYPSINSALDAGQIDAFAMDRSTLKTYTTDDKELLQPEIEFGAQDYGIATKKGCDLSEVTEAVVKDVTSNGWIDEEIKTWGLL